MLSPVVPLDQFVRHAPPSQPVSQESDATPLTSDAWYSDVHDVVAFTLSDRSTGWHVQVAIASTRLRKLRVVSEQLLFVLREIRHALHRVADTAHAAENERRCAVILLAEWTRVSLRASEGDLRRLFTPWLNALARVERR